VVEGRPRIALRPAPLERDLLTAHGPQAMAALPDLAIGQALRRARRPDVVPEHTQWCREQVAAHGGVDVVNLGDVDHIGAAIAGCR
jgi:hypothetical protein